VITTGSSPADTVQTNVVCELSSKISWPNEMGTIFGGSEILKKNVNQFPCDLSFLFLILSSLKII